MSFFKRLFKIGEAEANSAIDKLEDPIKLTEQGIRDLKLDLDKSLNALAEVKAIAIRCKNDVQTQTERAEEYESKAMALLQKAASGEIDSSEADRLATEALLKKEASLNLKTQSADQQKKLDSNVDQMDGNIKRIRSTISQYENELKTLKARVKVSHATKNLNKQLAQIDSSDTISMLERMKEKVVEDEALAEAYGDIANEARSVDEEIDNVLKDSAAQEKVKDTLAEMKKKLSNN